VKCLDSYSQQDSHNSATRITCKCRCTELSLETHGGAEAANLLHSTAKKHPGATHHITSSLPAFGSLASPAQRSQPTLGTTRIHIDTRRLSSDRNYARTGSLLKKLGTGH